MSFGGGLDVEKLLCECRALRLRLIPEVFADRRDDPLLKAVALRLARPALTCPLALLLSLRLQALMLNQQCLRQSRLRSMTQALTLCLLRNPPLSGRFDALLDLLLQKLNSRRGEATCLLHLHTPFSRRFDAELLLRRFDAELLLRGALSSRRGEATSLLQLRAPCLHLCPQSFKVRAARDHRLETSPCASSGCA